MGFGLVRFRFIRDRLAGQLFDALLQLLGRHLSLLEGSPFDAVGERQFRSEGLLKAVGGALRASGLPPEMLQLELTESLLADNAD